MTWNRRQLFQASGALAAGALLGGCSRESAPGGAGEGAKGPLTFWEHNGGLQRLHQEILEEFENSAEGVPVEYHYEPLKSFGQSLQLAKQSGQLPDVHTLAGLGLPVAQLVQEEWFQPLDLHDAVERLPADTLIEGITTFGGTVYTFPIISFRQYWTPTWYFSDRIAEFDLDPDSPPTTYDEFRSACAQVKQASDGNTYGWMAKLGAANHMSAEVDDLAQAAGFPGAQGLDFTTGEFAYDADGYVTALEFLLSLKQDELIHPASVSLPGAEAALRWAGGEAAFYFDGPWRPGLVVEETPQLSEHLRVAPMLVPEQGTPVTAYRPPQPGMYWIAHDSELGEEAGTLLREHFTTEQYFTRMAQSMGQVPLDLDAAAKAENVHPAYRQILEWYSDQVFLAPSPAVKNSDVSHVNAETRPVTPDIADTVNGLFSGELTDIRGSLKQLSGKLSAAREEAISVAKQKHGVDVDENAWAFPNWQPRTDYGNEMYDG